MCLTSTWIKVIINYLLIREINFWLHQVVLSEVVYEFLIIAVAFVIQYYNEGVICTCLTLKPRCCYGYLVFLLM